MYLNCMSETIFQDSFEMLMKTLVRHKIRCSFKHLLKQHYFQHCVLTRGTYKASSEEAITNVVLQYILATLV